jgi:hypothetical protein
MIDRTALLLSVQRALLGAISSDLRTVDVFWNLNQVDIVFNVDPESGDSTIFDNEIANSVEAEVEGDFLTEITVSSRIHQVANSAPVPLIVKNEWQGVRVYARRETT